MARPRKQGLDYFPLDVDIDQDDKIQLVEAVHGPVGFAIVIKLLMRIYKDGYYSKWTETEQLLFSKRVNVDINLINACINDCIKWGFFEKEMFENQAVLTSHGIQKRFLEAVGRRQKVEMVKEYLLLGSEDINVYKNLTTRSINVHINTVNDNINPQSIAKHSKEENSIAKQTETIETVDDDPVVKNDKEFAKVTQFYQSNIGPLVPHVGEELGYLVDAHPVELILEALKRALEANAKIKIRYAETILTNWKAQLLLTLDAVKAADSRRVNSFGNNHNQKVEKVPDWVAQQKADRASNNVVEDSVTPEMEEQRKALLEKLGVKE